ncbi:hypothetical protein JHU38_04295 [Prevotella sp. A2931]|uniref:PQQ-binding-like beta-propeller repeat protein n=1 Tax=Prevotella illustrans TaxID=2800387 RepID=A0ABS3M493_9BACT|nr:MULTISPECIES: hypothetical protein [Prevotella]MBO1363003.1 hypothetical protein [Prevotella illustrans]PTL25502.1 hypothetical protein C3V39_12765 [Prevotella sp. oral taxon 820]
MKQQHVWLAFALAFLPLSSKAQIDSIAIAKDVDGNPVKMASIDLKHTCYSLSVSPDGRTVAVKLRKREKDAWANSGQISLIDKTTGTTGWILPMKFSRTEALARLSNAPAGKSMTDHMKLTSRGLLVQDEGKLKLMTDATTEKWNTKLIPLYIDEAKDVIVGYRSATAAKLRGVSLSTGQELWVSNVKHELNWGWNDMQVVGDSLLMVAADDMNFINIKTGNLRRYDAATGKVDVGSVLLQSLGAVAMGAAMGAIGGFYTYYVPYVGANVTSHTCSNIATDGTYYYFADKAGVSCYDAQAQQVWTTAFDNKDGSYSQLTVKDGKLYLLNYGVGLKGGMMMKKYGKTFAAVLNAADGQLLSKDELEPWDKKVYGRPVSIPYVKSYTFRDVDKKLTPLEFDADRSVVITDKNKILIVNNKLQVEETFPVANHYDIYQHHGKYSFVGTHSKNGFDFWIVDDDGNAKLNFTEPVQAADLQGDTLYLLSGTRLLWMKLDDNADR